MSDRARTVVVAMALLVAACNSQPTPSTTASPIASLPSSQRASEAVIATPSATQVTTSGSLGDALALVGPNPQEIHFTDWAAIRASVGAEDLTGASSFEDKAGAIRNDVTLGGFGLTELKTHATDWGFDVFDLEWEAVVRAPRAPLIWVLRIRQGFDLASLTAKLDEYGFATEQLPHGVLRTGTMDRLLQSERQLRNISFLNTGLLDDGRTLVLSSEGGERGDAVRALLTSGLQPVADPSVLSVGRLLDAPLAASFSIGLDCRVVVEQAFVGAPADVRAAVDEQLAEAGPPSAYNVVAGGYGRTGGVTSGTIVIGYPEEGQAEADLEGRRSLAADGISSISRDASALVRYRDRIFVVVDARAVDRSIVLDLGPPEIELRSADPSANLPTRDLLPRFLAETFLRRDMLFAAC